MSMWQLKKLSTNEPLSDPQPLPENWGPIFGLRGFVDQIGDLSWLGQGYSDQGWVQVEGNSFSFVASKSELEWDRAKKLLQESDWTVLSDVPMSSEEKALWIEYRRQLREIKLQSGFPDDIIWPIQPR